MMVIGFRQIGGLAMGLFGKMFEKKTCAFCGEDIGLFGNRKLEDGNMCKECASLLSPWFSDRKNSTVAEIQEQLLYREENKAKLEAFHTTRSLGRNVKVLVDEEQNLFMVSRTRNIKEENPDILAFSQVTGCDLDIDEERHEITYEDKDGNEVSYNPKRYEYEYNFYMIIRVNHAYFDEIKFLLNQSSVIGKGTEYNQYKEMGTEICNLLSDARQNVRDQIAEAKASKTAMVCPFCGATTIPDTNGCCEYCGGAMNI